MASMRLATGEFEGVEMRLGKWTERTPSPLTAIASAELPAAGAELMGTTMCLGRAWRLTTMVQPAV